MRWSFGHERRILLATVVCAAGAPLTAASWVAARTAALADHLGAASGQPARIGAIDADLTGTIRLTGVALGPLFTAEAVEASVALDSLLAGTLRADEIRIASPRVAIRVDRDGDSDLARVARRLVGRSRAPGEPGEPGRLRRIVVSSGALTAQIDGLGSVAADGVELIPDAGGVRLITGAVRLDGRAGPLHIELGFARGAAELTLPHLRFGPPAQRRRARARGRSGRARRWPAPAPRRRGRPARRGPHARAARHR